MLVVEDIPSTVRSTRRYGMDSGGRRPRSVRGSTGRRTYTCPKEARCMLPSPGSTKVDLISYSNIKVRTVTLISVTLTQNEKKMKRAWKPGLINNCWTPNDTVFLSHISLYFQIHLNQIYQSVLNTIERQITKLKIVKNPLLFLHQCTFTMHRPRVPISQWGSKCIKGDGCTSLSTELLMHSNRNFRDMGN